MVMRTFSPVFKCLLVVSLGAGAFADTPVVAQPCAVGATGCEVSKQDLKRARKIFERGLKFQRENKNQEAFEAFEQADQMVPHDINYSTAKEVLRQQMNSFRKRTLR